ncbi:hypothetical protein NBO_10g0073 [Nosema bombycis CQ1]|uniref:Uncharacterized protein n=1 Tax=Nosema bombycis (strain CQ1 / CVCC 102059) TaxID=578461 RepID=R0MQC1_NOSB1|nr:hypothetical protein NBO_10g0073 [Nosema bombycis CQ1]|eukprot:EOB15083.1 hypothetical protein NBO_10g0073 [Nosema bombycis CQ1]
MIPNYNDNEKSLKGPSTFRKVYKSLTTKIKPRIDDNMLPITKEFQEHNIYFREEKKITTDLGEKNFIFFSEEIKIISEVEPPLNQKMNCLTEDEKIITNFKESFIATKQKAYFPDDESSNTNLLSRKSITNDSPSALDKIVFTDDVLFHVIIYVLIAVLFIYLLVVCALKIVKFIKNESRKEKLKWQYEVVDTDDYN